MNNTLTCDQCGEPAFVVANKRFSVLGQILFVLLTLLSVFLWLVRRESPLLPSLPLVVVALPGVAALGFLYSDRFTEHHVKCTRCGSARLVPRKPLEQGETT